jgi:hypothetical protein
MRKRKKDVLRTYQGQEKTDDPHREGITENIRRGKEIRWLLKGTLKIYAKQAKRSTEMVQINWVRGIQRMSEEKIERLE